MNERAYEVLLRLYPAGHPRDEMLDVLLTARRPMWREVPALVVGALRARTGNDHRWLYAARAAALLLLIHSAVGSAREVEATWLPLSTMQILVWVAVALAVGAIIAGWRVPAALAGVAAFAISAADGVDWRSVTAYSLAAVLLIIPGPSTPVRNPILLALALVPLDAVALGTAPSWLIGLGVLLWAVVDERVALAVGLAFCVAFLQVIADLPGSDARGVLILTGSRVGFVAAFLLVGAWVARRRVRV
ncbi:hypothetical protein M1L60_28465 [Actinoplanes sp. TRM 88003]|uniref:Uncharacterized protein n=1 Tax=Paractinoplanes aksuensis TaxID=2939490 RepID=A0ABT1DUP0_9ACTN|nr:hypothetical protein [Actinoplanes aksuensis]MCO8274538.1 hypothetical protein [Actinoplanes aksuensis]